MLWDKQAGGHASFFGLCVRTRCMPSQAVSQIGGGDVSESAGGVHAQSGWISRLLQHA